MGLSATLALGTLLAALPLAAGDLRLGMIGLDTSHVIEITRLLNEPANPNHVPGARVVAAYKGGSPDMPLSANRVEGFTSQLRERYGVEIVPDIPALCKMVDGVLLESVDGRVHAEQARQVFAAHKPVFIDKPLAVRLSDAFQIAEWGVQTGTPWFSASLLRFSPEFQELRADPRIGAVYGIESYGRAVIEPTNPGLFYYGIHAVEALYAVMGAGCETVTMTANADFDLAVGQWRDGRIGTVRGIRKGDASFGLLAFGDRGIRLAEAPPWDQAYANLVRQLVRFFETRQPPVTSAETLETIAFIEAAEQSRNLGGVPVKLHSRPGT